MHRRLDDQRRQQVVAASSTRPWVRTTASTGASRAADTSTAAGSLRVRRLATAGEAGRDAGAHAGAPQVVARASAACDGDQCCVAVSRPVGGACGGDRPAVVVGAASGERRPSGARRTAEVLGDVEDRPSAAVADAVPS